MRALVDPPSPVVDDLFTGTNATAISDHTPDTQYSGGWVQSISTGFHIQNNSIQPNRYTNGDTAVIETGLSDFTLTCTLTPFNSGTNRGAPGIIFRYTDASNFWYCYALSDDNSLNIAKVESGAGALQSITQHKTIQSDKSFTVRIDCWDKNITFFIDGIEQFTLCDTFSQTATKAGLYCGKSNAPASKPSWDNFKVQRFLGTKIDWPTFTNQDTTTPLIALGATGQFDDADANNPNVCWDEDNNRWVLGYSGNDGTNVQDFGLAFATTITGPYTKYASNPAFESAAADEFGLNGGLVKFKGTWYAYYGSATATKISCQSSPDLVTWTSRGVVLNESGKNNWEHTAVWDCTARVTPDGNTVELWYCGKNGSNVGGLGYATSTDGINFTRQGTKPLFSTLPFAIGNFGEPHIWVPEGMEGKQMLITLQGARHNLDTTRFIVQALTFNGGNDWHFRVNALTKAGSGWMSVQVFDPEVIVQDGVMYLFHAGADVTGNVLDINCQIGLATAPFPNGKFTAT